MEFNPKEPPVSVSVEVEPPMIITGEAVAEVGPVELTITIVLTQVVELHAF